MNPSDLPHREQVILNTSPPQQTPLLDARIEQLDDKLGEILGVYTVLETHMVAKKQLIIEGDPDRLQAHDQTLHALTQQLTQLENERLTLMKALGYGETHTLEFVIQDRQQQPEAQPVCTALQQKRYGLQQLTRSIQKLNLDHKMLLENSLSWIAQTVDILASVLVPEAAAYGANGKKKHAWAKSGQSGAEAVPTRASIKASAYAGDSASTTERRV